MTPTVVSDAAGRVRFTTPWLRGRVALAVAVEDALDAVPGVRQAHAHPRTGAVVVWYDPASDARAALSAVIAGATADAPARRAPRSAEVGNGDLLRMALGAVALLLLGGRRYVLRRPPVLGPTSRLAATGVTIVNG